jgi:hemoglobin/transferrin/lactoferrin receptor protein
MGRLVLNNLVDHFDQLSVFTYYQDLDVYQRSTIYNDPVNNGRLNMVLQDIVKTFGTTVQTDWSFGDHTVIAGFEYIYDDLTGYTRPGGITNPINVIEGSQTTKAVYLQDSWNVYGPITLVGGLRHTWVDMELSRFTEIPNLEKELSFTNLVGNLGLTVAVNDDLVLRAQYAQGFRTPDMAAKLTGTGDYIVPNYDLEPETSENYEIGARYYDGQLYADLSLFYNVVEDYMATKYLYTINNHWVSEYVNSSQYTAYGLELAAAWRIGETGFTPYGNITSIHTELEENDIKTRNTGTPKTWGTLGLKWETGLGDSGRFFTDASYRISGGSKLGATSWYDVHAGRTMDLTFGLEYGEAQKFKAIVSVRNVFDKDYEPAYFYYPGRHVVVSVSYMF